MMKNVTKPTRVTSENDSRTRVMIGNARRIHACSPRSASAIGHGTFEWGVEMESTLLVARSGVCED